MTNAGQQPKSQPSNIICWVCGSQSLSLVKPGNLPDNLAADAFQITDSRYGQTADIFKCSDCGFLECPTLPDVLNFYAEMDDTGYEDTRAERALQAEGLLKALLKVKPGGRLLDVGAGSGILVAAAKKIGFDAQGIEPSVALQRRAVENDIPVKLGILPSADVTGPFDSITLVDVIEHVPDPVGLLTDISTMLSEDGVCMVVTPDVKSQSARIMGWRWWHFRIAHIGYFDRSTLTRAINAAGMDIVSIGRPTWYFPAKYLIERVFSYLPSWLRLPVPSIFSRLTIPLNLFDSYTVLCRKR
jgi:SAM-dependent methyltransferase